MCEQSGGRSLVASSGASVSNAPHPAQLVPIHSVSIDHTSIVHLPLYVGLLQHEQERVVAIHGGSGNLSERLLRLLTSQLAHIRGSFAR